MATNLVNLDAIIPREDWDALPDKPSQDVQSPDRITFKCIEFEKGGLAFQFLRKPEFQRETASWTPQKVADLVKCFVEGDLIPSIIIWRNEQSKNLFVIDGAHRLGALIAWVHDDYGDGQMSRVFFKNQIPPEQQRAANITRDLVAKSVGAYHKIKSWDTKSDTKEANYAFRLLTRQVIVQEIGGGSQKAEDSFYKINQQAAPITPTELQLIKSRKKAYGIATRAVVRAGVGHKFWNQFSQDAQKQIEEIADEIYSLLFTPPLSNPIHIGLDLPIGGRGYSTEAIGLALELVNLNIAPPKKKLKRSERPKKKAEETPEPPDDPTGEQTINLLREVKKTTRRMAGKELQSLGLHSAVYFYSATGRFQPSAFLATASLIREIETERKFLWFTVHRSKFEHFLVQHRYLVNQMVIKHGGMEKSHEPMLDMYRTILALASENKANEDILTQLISKFPHLRKQDATDFLTTNEEASGGMKNAMFRKAGLAKLHCCFLCKAPIHPNAVSVGHDRDIKHGGKGNLGNLDPWHPFCNGAKDQLLPLFNIEPPQAWPA